MSWVKLGDLLDGYHGRYLIKKKSKKRENKALAILPWLFNLMGIPENF